MQVRTQKRRARSVMRRSVLQISVGPLSSRNSFLFVVGSRFAGRFRIA
jgi:hypothetical protein